MLKVFLQTACCGIWLYINIRNLIMLILSNCLPILTTNCSAPPIPRFTCTRAIFTILGNKTDRYRYLWIRKAMHDFSIFLRSFTQQLQPAHCAIGLPLPALFTLPSSLTMLHLDSSSLLFGGLGLVLHLVSCLWYQVDCCLKSFFLKSKIQIENRGPTRIRFFLPLVTRKKDILKKRK